MDSKTTIQQLKNSVRKMREARGWKHEPRGYAISIVLEASELLEHFQWEKGEMNKEEMEMEVADILIYLSEFCEVFDIDWDRVVKAKIKKIDEKYPAEKIKSDPTGVIYYEQKKKYRDKKL